MVRPFLAMALTAQAKGHFPAAAKKDENVSRQDAKTQKRKCRTAAPGGSDPYMVRGAQSTFESSSPTVGLCRQLKLAADSLSVAKNPN